MKKVLFALAFVAFASVSCSKKYTCTCTVDGVEQAPFEIDAKKSEAETVCNTAQTTQRVFDPNATCVLD
jgi:hypothetical protein